MSHTCEPFGYGDCRACDRLPLEGLQHDERYPQYLTGTVPIPPDAVEKYRARMAERGEPSWQEDCRYCRRYQRACGRTHREAPHD